MDYVFQKATIDDLSQIYDLINARMDWMVKKGIKQWDKEHYWSVFPKSHYQKQVELGNMYVIKTGNEVMGAIVLYEQDELWLGDENIDSFYLHHLVTSLKHKGIGKIIIKEVEKLGKEMNKQAIRLDCMVTNEFLNRYYEDLGYYFVGTCQDGIYYGNKREKRI